MRLRRSSEIFGRKSIASKMTMRRSTTYVPGMNQKPNESQPPDIPKPKHSPSMFVERKDAQPMFPTAMPKTNLDPVKDIVDDAEDIL